MWAKSEQAKSEQAKSEQAKSEQLKFPQITVSSMELFVLNIFSEIDGEMCVKVFLNWSCKGIEWGCPEKLMDVDGSGGFWKDSVVYMSEAPVVML